MTLNDKPIIYVDTTCLRGLSFHDPDWQVLLEASKQRTLRIAISEVAFQERCSQWRDELKAKANIVKDAIDKLTAAWNNSPITRNSSINDNPYLIAEIKIFDFEKYIEDQVIDYANNFIKEYDIEIRKIQEHHTEEVLRKYFCWEEPFDSPTKDRDTRDIREKRKKNIPDAWIIEEAIDLKASGRAIYVLCKDKKMIETFIKKDIQVFETAEGISAKLNRKQQEEVLLVANQQNVEPRTEFSMTGNLASLFNTDLITKVLGNYSGWRFGKKWFPRNTCLRDARTLTPCFLRVEI